jgi:tRNA pseudouridine55 synthase
MRTIAHDLGVQFGVGAHLSRLRRLASGEFDLTRAHTLEQLGTLAGENRFSECVIPAAQLLSEIPAASVDAVTAGQIRQGRSFRTSPFRSTGNSLLVKAVTETGELVAIAKAAMPYVYQPVLVL